MRNRRDRYGAGARLSRVIVWLAGLAAAGCGNLTPGGFGNIHVDVSGDADEPAPASGASAASPSWSLLEGPAATSHDVPEGEVEVEFELFLVTEDGVVSQLGGDDIRVRVDVQGRTDVDAVSELVPAATYTELRVVFTEIEAEIEKGLLIDGVPVLGLIRVDMDDLTLEVTRPLDLVLEPDGVAELLVDLNASAWLSAVDPLTKLVDAAVFAALLEIVVLP